MLIIDASLIGMTEAGVAARMSFIATRRDSEETLLILAKALQLRPACAPGFLEIHVRVRRAQQELFPHAPVLARLRSTDKIIRML